MAIYMTYRILHFYSGLFRLFCHIIYGYPHKSIGTNLYQVSTSCLCFTSTNSIERKYPFRREKKIPAIFTLFTFRSLSRSISKYFDPLGRPTVTAGRENCFCTCRPYVPNFQNLAEQNKVKTMLASGETVGPAEWITYTYFCLFFSSTQKP